MLTRNKITSSLYLGMATGDYCDGARECGGVRTGSSFANVFTDNILTGNILTGNNLPDDGSPEILIQYYTHGDRFLRNRVTDTDAATSLAWLGTRYSSISAFQRATGQDPYSTLTVE